MQHATERVERPGESQEALDGKKESVNTEEICCDSPDVRARVPSGAV